MITVDLRSDTVTKPTPGMLEAMWSAKVGDDVFGEDETVNALEQKAPICLAWKQPFLPIGHHDQPDSH
jgi:threonine aldolase